MFSIYSVVRLSDLPEVRLRFPEYLANAVISRIKIKITAPVAGPLNILLMETSRKAAPSKMNIEKIMKEGI